MNAGLFGLIQDFWGKFSFFLGEFKVFGVNSGFFWGEITVFWVNSEVFLGEFSFLG